MTSARCQHLSVEVIAKVMTSGLDSSDILIALQDACVGVIHMTAVEGKEVEVGEIFITDLREGIESFSRYRQGKQHHE
jgi:hypothetical protein